MTKLKILSDGRRKPTSRISSHKRASGWQFRIPINDILSTKSGRETYLCDLEQVLKIFVK